MQSISIAFCTVTNVYDIDKLISGYLSQTINEHALHATSLQYMKIIPDRVHWKKRYFQSVRYIEYGFPLHTNSSSETHSTNDKIYKKLNFIQSISYYYCGMNISCGMNTSMDNVWIDESQLYMNSVMFPIQIVESYEFVRSEVCERMALGLYQSIVDMFKPDTYVESNQRSNLIIRVSPNVKAELSFSQFIGNVASFISSKTHPFFSLQSIGVMYRFLVKFGEFESYKETVIHNIWQMDSSLALQLNVFSDSDIDICMNQIKHPKMHKYVTNTLKQQVNFTGNKSFILEHDKTADAYNLSGNFWRYAKMYQVLTGSTAIKHQVENDTVEIVNLFQLLRECQWKHRYTERTRSTGSTLVDCALIAFGIYESYEGNMDGHEYVLNALKCIISNNDLYCSKLSPSISANETYFQHSRSMYLMLRDLRQSLIEDVFYPYLNELINDTQFVSIINNNTDHVIDGYLQTTLSKLMVVALEEYKDTEMVKKIATVFKPKINVCKNCIFESKYDCDSLVISWMDVLVIHECMHLKKYFQQRFKHQISKSSVYQTNYQMKRAA